MQINFNSIINRQYGSAINFKGNIDKTIEENEMLKTLCM